MINTIIIKYLRENRRLVIPKLGAFIVKDDNQTIIFSELLRSDDGVLRGLIKGHGVGDIEAAGVIDRFVFEVRHTIDRHMPYKIGNLGTLSRNESGKIVFMSFRPQLQQPSVRPMPKPQPAPVASVANESNATIAEPNDAEQPKTKSSNRYPAKRKPDVFMIVAVIVAVVAVCAILYGVLCGKDEAEMMPFPEIENVESDIDSAMGMEAEDYAPNSSNR